MKTILLVEDDKNLADGLVLASDVAPAFEPVLFVKLRGVCCFTDGRWKCEQTSDEQATNNSQSFENKHTQSVSATTNRPGKKGGAPKSIWNVGYR